MNRFFKPIAAAAIVFMLIWTISRLTNIGHGIGNDQPKQLTLTEYLQDVKKGQVQTAHISESQNTITGDFVVRGSYTVDIYEDNPNYVTALTQTLVDNGVNVNPEKPPMSQMVQNILSVIIAPVVLLGLFWLFFLRQAQAGGNQAMSFGRSRAKRLSESVPKVTFEDVAGVDEAKAELQEVVEFLKNSKKFTMLGAKIPKGVLLLGPPGCGKTMLSRAIAGEAGVPFFHISGSDFVEMFVGVGASRVRDLFETAKANRPSLIFIDEIDAVGRQRGAGLGGGHDEREQTLNQLLVEMDGFEPNSGVIMIAATNRPDVLDPALLRPGRFDRQVTVDVPTSAGREAILNVHIKGKPLGDNVEMNNLAKRTPGFSGADLANLVNEAAILAVRKDKQKIEMEDFNEAIDRVIAGPERKSKILSDKDKQVVAYHELGHAITSELLPLGDPVHKISILPRGRALGYMIPLPDEDKYLISKSQFIDEISSLLGGRVAEHIVYGEFTTGASSDFERATAKARAMVCQYGMSDVVGPLVIGGRHGNPFLGRDWMEERNYSDEMALEIDKEIRAIIDICYQKAWDVLSENRSKMDAIAAVLLDKEVLEREEFIALLEGTHSVSTEPPSSIEPTSAPSGPVTKAPDKDKSPSVRVPKLRPEPGVA